MDRETRMMIVDIHVHSQLGERAGDPCAGLDRIIALADKAGIDRLCLLGNVSRFGAHMSIPQVRAINDTTLALVQHRPGRVFGFCFLNPQHDPGFLREEIARCVVDGGLRGVKLETDVNARDERLGTIMRRAAELGVPVLHHAWYKTVQKGVDESDPSDIADLARRFPAATIIMAHLIAAGIRGVLDVQRCENVFVDTSGSQPVAGILEYAVAKLGAERILYGSDVCGRDFSCQLGKVYGARIRERERDLILGLNAARLLKLDSNR